MPYCKNCGNEIAADARYCPICGVAISSVVSERDVLPFDQSASNTSGMGKQAVIPPEIKGWNWGAFFLSWIWGIRNRTYIALLCLIPFVAFVMVFVLGAKGSEWSWRNHKWKASRNLKTLSEHGQSLVPCFSLASWGWVLALAF
jgi:hypothetical protein